ncbi:DUF916 and DUF3324 domain-containing protein [Enterococcus sp. 5H]|uniref:DUF916 and DUF3324 domain-containing protein n=1 Tax=Enterococcus sp. 5H TaxID=1229490 RepID=UPI002302E440|nr:DUF916 and DUF3324 domain-containing protein [Enterococcus sp. 5H]MDA9471069.1 cell surface protein [Enterococcus sp. 5H]
MTNKRKSVHMGIVMLGFFLLLFVSVVVKTERCLAVSVQPILPKNQHNVEATYYDLRVTPGQEQELKLELINTSDVEQKVVIQINDATTNEKGDIDYSDRTSVAAKDDSLNISLKDIATTDPEISVPAKETKIATVRLKMPKDQFNGMILGGIKVISFEEKNTDKHEEKVYIVAVKLTETDVPVKAELDLLKLSPSQISGENVFKATIQNNQAINLEDIEYVAEVYTKESNELVQKTKVTGYRMAPNSTFIWTVKGEKQAFQSGKYKIHLTAKSQDTNQEWQWDEDVEFAQIKEEKNGNSIMGTDKKHLMFYTIISVITFVFLLVLLLVLLILRKRKEKRYKEAIYYEKKRRKRKQENAQRNGKSQVKGRKRRLPRNYQENN